MPVEIPPPAVVIEDPQLAIDARILSVLHEMENPNNVRTPGKHGELGPWQITREAWEVVSSAPFTVENAFGPEGRRAVESYIRVLRKVLRSNDRPDGPAAVAGAWNGGPSNAVRDTLPQSALLYAIRFSNLYYAHDPRSSAGK